ncbi:hypothetical protein [Desulfofundulus thermosubterraneus]|uniref:CAAX protease self-immunity n=1 Tax=Desulfofundulus thermosubterraneus DSM 16057 TaxID=1121432 RepID=A0A1M6CVP3_9FIRM|nr:hypothetical protein [Desulfofundulus thermosubterraneus]SHI64874.1 hypothetical protein SAMN02745219_00769 [Desulfofundulus thermosubterraneus DSM 16057]
MNQLAFIPAGVLAAATSWLVNGLIFSRAGVFAVVYVAPGVEEAAKTSFALFLGTSIPLAHFIFGLVEGLWEAARGGRGWAAGLVSLASHTAFGLAAGWLYRLTTNALLAVAGAYLLHMSWNKLVVNLSGKP